MLASAMKFMGADEEAAILVWFSPYIYIYISILKHEYTLYI